MPSALIHGQRVAYRIEGSGPAVVLIHGLFASGAGWKPLMRRLSERHTVVALDLLGHGESDKPRRWDYSLGSHASLVRDLLAVLEIERATIVGHSLGGGIAMIFAYQYAERVERLVLVSSGGLGREVSLPLRALCAPGAGALLALVCGGPTRRALGAGSRLLSRRGLKLGASLGAAAKSLDVLGTPELRGACLRSLRAAVDTGGQSVDASERLYIAGLFPTLIMWGDRDGMIPAAHGRSAERLMPGSRLVSIAGAGHYPHLSHPDAVAGALGAFLAETDPAPARPDPLGELLRARMA